MRTCKLYLLAIFLLPGLASGASFTPLGSFRASGISADGSVLVGACQGQACRWTAAGGPVALGDLPGGIDGISSASDVSADGAVVVGFVDGPLGREALRWTAASGMVGLGYLIVGANNSVANGVSADGSVVVGRVSTDPIEGVETQAFRWTSAGGLVAITSGQNGAYHNEAIDVSADGSVVAGHVESAGHGEAFRWTATGGVVLLDMGGFSTQAAGISADGSTVVGNHNDMGTNSAFRWTSEGGLVLLGEPGGTFSYASDVSADGSVVVGYSGYNGSTVSVWNQAGGIKKLFDILSADGVTSHTGWTLSQSTAISDDGNWITGNGRNAQGQFEHFLANIVPVTDAVDDGPIAATEGIAEVIPVGANDTGFGNPATVTVTTLPTKGTIGAISPPGPAAGMTITYTANIGALGADSFVYDMTDSTPVTDSATVALNISPDPDTDGDGVLDRYDNCTLVANPTQCDSDADGFGNHCDGDLTQNGVVNSQDYVVFRSTLGAGSGQPTYNIGDLNCNGFVNAQDYVLFRRLLGSPPGPAGLLP